MRKEKKRGVEGAGKVEGGRGKQQNKPSKGAPSIKFGKTRGGDGSCQFLGRKKRGLLSLRKKL